jgi:hypothetical protein
MPSFFDEIRRKAEQARNQAEQARNQAENKRREADNQRREADRLRNEWYGHVGIINNLNKQHTTDVNTISTLTNQVKLAKEQATAQQDWINYWQLQNTNANKTIIDLSNQINQLNTQVKNLQDLNSTYLINYNNAVDSAEIAIKRVDGIAVTEGFNSITGYTNGNIDGNVRLTIASLGGLVGGTDSNSKDGIIADIKSQKKQDKYEDALLYQAIYQQNKTLERKIQETKNGNTTDTQKIGYIQDKLDSATTVSFYMLIVYYIVLFISIYFFYINVTMTRNTKLLIFTGFAVYPWVIYLLEEWIYYLLSYIFSVALGTPFRPGITLVRTS